MFRENDSGQTRRTMLRTCGACLVGAGAAGSVAGSQLDIISLSGTYDSPISVNELRSLQRQYLSDVAPDMTPMQLPGNLGDNEVVEYRLLPTTSGVKQFVGTAANPESTGEVRSDAAQFEDEFGGVTTTQQTDSSLTITGWDWDNFARFSNSDKPKGKVTIGSHFAGKGDTPNSGDYAYGIVTDYEQIPGTEVNAWENSGWINSDARIQNKWHKGDFSPTGYDYGPTNTAGQFTYGFNVGFSGATPEMGVNFSTTVEGGCKNRSEYDLPLADHTYKILDKVDTTTLSMTPASTAYIDAGKLDSSDQTLTTATGTGGFSGFLSSDSVIQNINYIV